MHSLNTRYAKFYNRYMNRCGLIFRDRYRCESIINQNHLNSCVRFIHNNPVHANLCIYPVQYPFSSYLKYKNHQIEKNTKITVMGYSQLYSSIR